MQDRWNALQRVGATPGRSQERVVVPATTVTEVSPYSPEAVPRGQRQRRTAEALAAAKTADPEARDELIEEVVRLNMGVARSVAGRYFNRGVDEEDLIQVSFLALTRAAKNFDADRHRDFLAYAVPTIRGELKKHFRDHGWTVRPPRRVQETQGLITSAEADLVQKLGRSPRPSELAAHLGLDLADVEEALSADGCFTPTSLDRPLDSPGQVLGDLLADDHADLPAAEARATLAPVVRRLKERDRRILYLRFFEDRTQQEIATEIGVTQMQVSRLITRIMRDLRTELEDPVPRAS
jgi:RNA polymerase sigma-B factor